MIIAEREVKNMIDGLSSYYSNLYTSGMSNNAVSSNTSANVLEDALNSTELSKATDDELMDVCKSFESYFVEQVLKAAKKTVLSEDEEEGDYIQYFGDTLVQEYSDIISDKGNLGIAQMLYDSMKRNGA